MRSIPVFHLMRQKLAPLACRLDQLRSHFGRLLAKTLIQTENTELVEIRPSRMKIRVIGVILVLILVWSMLFSLDMASHSVGEVISATHTKYIQHLEGGIVRKILVKEGQRVKAGSPVVELERTASEADLREAQSHLGSLQIRALRLEAQLAGKQEIVFSPNLLREFPEQTRNAYDLIRSQSERINSGLAAQQQKIVQRNAELTELRARKTHLLTKLVLLRDQIKISQSLLKEGLTNQYEHLHLLKEEQAQISLLAETEAALTRVAAAHSQESSSLNSQRSGEREQQQKDLEDTRRQIGEIEERLKKFSDSQKRQLILTPIDGTIMTLNVVTEGGVVPPGGTLMSIVPDNDPLLIETQLPVGDVGFIEIGQKTRIQLMSTSAHGFAPIDGTVTHISADRVAEPNREPYYRLHIKPDQLFFSRGDVRYRLVPGVRVSAAVLVGHHSVFDYLSAPLRASARGALSEP